MPVISTDYMGLTKREPGEGDNLIIVLIDRKSKMKHANVIKNKGADDHYSIQRVALEIINMDYRHFVFESDQDSAILAMKEAVTRRVTAIKGEGVQIVPEVSPVVESQCNGDIDNAVKQVQGQFGTIRSQLQSTYTTRENENSEVLAWLVPHASHSSKRYLVGPDGRTPRQRFKGRSFETEAAHFGECVWYLMPESTGVNKLNSRWKAGV